MVNLALNTKLASGPTTDTGPVCSGLLDDDITSPKLAPVVQFAAIGTAQSVPTFDEQKALFFSAFHFAVVGASTDKNKYGFKTLKRLIDLRKDVVPVNPTATEILGIKCIKSLSDLPEPTLTAVSVVCKPQASVTLAILKEAKSLNILALWLQPGAEDDAVVEFIEADAQLMERCIYQKRPLHSSAVHTAPCLLTATAHLMPPTPVAGQKHAILSPPSTPPAAKSLKLSAESTASPRKIADSVADLSQEIPGLA
ncbi:CoA binding domain-containing protein [Mycena alexandri]|uniref:CoA binding domain-containing protein n=1 Tax=Mycena alexandri TaxID=1745969 RepID=A0AAD6TCJ0_9AGAR|nr:CoA binding domain-containing protein [Mycena alexandri]